MVEESIALGVPEITQVLRLIDAHDGSAGEVVQELIGEPFPLRAFGAKVKGTPTTPIAPTRL